MLTRFFSYILIASITLSLLPACTKRAPTPVASHLKEKDSGTPIVQTRPLGKFNHITVEGVVNLRLHTGYAKPEVILHGDARDLANVITTINYNTLSIRLPIPPKFGAVTADIHGSQLNSLIYRGAGTIKGDNIHSNLLDLLINNPQKTTLSGNINLHKLEVMGPSFVEINGVKSPYLQVGLKGNPHVQITGVARIAHLDIKGSGWFSLYWVSNDVLTIRAKEAAFVQLAGIANRLDLELGGAAHFNGRYLRASRTFVKTRNRAVAEINSVDRQHTLATDASDIRFYNVPVLKTDFMACNGAVLDMRDWSLPFPKEYNRYNKDVPLGDWP